MALDNIRQRLLLHYGRDENHQRVH
jgi:hypothetical protein